MEMWENRLLGGRLKERRAVPKVQEGEFEEAGCGVEVSGLSLKVRLKVGDRRR